MPFEVWLLPGPVTENLTPFTCCPALLHTVAGGGAARGLVRGSGPPAGPKCLPHQVRIVVKLHNCTGGAGRALRPKEGKLHTASCNCHPCASCLQAQGSGRGVAGAWPLQGRAGQPHRCQRHLATLARRQPAATGPGAHPLHGQGVHCMCFTSGVLPAALYLECLLSRPANMQPSLTQDYPALPAFRTSTCTSGSRCWRACRS